MLAKLTPRERNKLTFKRKRDKGFITDLGWTRAILYAGCKVLLVDLVVVVNKFHIVKGIFLIQFYTKRLRFSFISFYQYIQTADLSPILFLSI